MSGGKIQRVELNVFYYVALHCPFCGQKVTPSHAEMNEGATVSPCAHTLFFAHDEGFEFRSPRFNENVGTVGLTSDDDEWPNGSYDQLTDEVTLTDAVKFAQYVGPPSGLGAYVGFAPTEED